MKPNILKVLLTAMGVFCILGTMTVILMDKVYADRLICAKQENVYCYGEYEHPDGTKETAYGYECIGEVPTPWGAFCGCKAYLESGREVIVQTAHCKIAKF